MANSILKLKVETSEYDQKLANAAKGIRHLADVAHKGAGELTGLEKSEVDYIKALGDMETKSRTASGQVRELSSTYKELKVIYDQLNEVEKADEGGKALAASLATLKQRAQEAKAQLDTATQSLNDNGEAGKGTSSVMEMLKDKFTVNIDAIKLFNIGLQAAEGALSVAKDAFFQSESNIDEWGRTVEGAKGAYSVFLDTLNNGNWSNFFQNLSAAIQGGRDLYDIFDRLGSIKSNNAAAIAMVQQQIAQLRLAKQQGENVDAQLKEATARLAQLQKQSVTAGKAAGNKLAFEVIRNGVNSVGGARYNDATINYVIDNIMKNGQSEFDKYKNNYQTLRNRGMVTKTQTIYDSQGGTYERQYKEFDINALTKEQQKQYSLAKAITEGETLIQKGIAAYAQAVQEGTASAREEFKGNRYALQGSNGGGGNTNNEPTYAPDSIVAQQALVQQLTKQWNEAGADVRDQYLQPLVEAEAKLKEMQNTMDLQKAQAEGKLNGVNLWQGDIDDISGGKTPQFTGSLPDLTKSLQLDNLPQFLSPLQQLNAELEQLRENLEYAPTTEAYQEGLKAIADKEKEIASFKGIDLAEDADKSAKSFQEAAGAISKVGSALNSIEDPTAKILGIIAQGIAGVVAGAGQAVSAKDTTSSGWAWIGAAAAITASMITMISQIHSATGYAQGGIVDGRGGGFVGGMSYSGDNVGNVRLDSGELVLNRAQQTSLANQLQSSPMSQMQLSAVVTGEQIRLVLNNNGRRTGRGEYVTTNFT